MANEEEREGTVKRPTGSPALSTLTTPCTLQQLRVWLQGVDTQTSGEEALAAVTTTSTSISVA
jgi:hypothetical protein